MSKLGDPAWKSEFQAFYEHMPEDERSLAIRALAEAGLPNSEEFLKAYALGCGRVMCYNMTRVAEDEPEQTDPPHG